MEYRDNLILKKILTYCNRLEDNLSRFDNSFDAFKKDVLFQDACCMCVVQIGELSCHLSDEFRNSYKDIPWRIIKDTRNLYVHDYGNVDLELVWNTIIDDIPVLKNFCEEFVK